MPANAQSEDWLSITAEQIRLLFGISACTEKPLKSYAQFGYHGYAIRVYAEHIAYLNSLTALLSAHVPVFDGTTVARWKAVNDLLVAGFSQAKLGTVNISDQIPAMAALVAFPTLEEVSRRLSSRWNEEGRLLDVVPISDGVSTWNPDGSSKPKSYKAGDRIVLLSHKLQLMHRSLHPDLAWLIGDLDKFLQRPTIQGVAQPMSPLYERLQYFRDHWSHGRRFEGWEALLVSLLLALLYFGTALSNHQRVGSDPEA